MPSLAALQAFAALAETGSLSAAAERLGLTASAISHQLRALERQLGATVLVRQGRGLVLTDDGRRYAARVRHALADMAVAAAELQRRDTPDRLTVSAPASLIALWLLPQLAPWLRQHPKLQLHWLASPDTPDAPADTSDNADCTLRFGSSPWPGQHSEHLMGDSLLLVAARQFNHGVLPGTVANALRGPLLDAGEPWSPWLAAAGVLVQPVQPQLQFSQASHLVDAVCQGLGLALVRRTLVQQHLRSGALVQVTSVEAAHPAAYQLLWPRRPVSHPAAQAFGNWLHHQAAAAGQAPLAAPLKPGGS